MSDKPLVSVIVPAYNAERTIDETLLSIRAQTHVALEVLVVDDGSKDRTAELALAHAAQDSRVRLIRQVNGGVAAARNRGIAEAKSEFIAPVDADDLWKPTKIERQLEVMLADERIALVYTFYSAIDGASQVLQFTVDPPRQGDVLRHICRGNFVGNGSAALMRRPAILEAGGYDSSLRARRAQGCEDLELYYRIAKRHHFGCVAEHLVGYRQLPDNMSSDVMQMYRSWVIVRDEMLADAGQFRREIRHSEVDLCRWLLDKALAGGKRGDAVRLIALMFRASLVYAAQRLRPKSVLRRLIKPAPVIVQTDGPFLATG